MAVLGCQSFHHGFCRKS